jgi:hypothetical protein
MCPQAKKNSSKEEAEKIWLDVYNDMFSTRLGSIVRNDIRDSHAYLVKYITNQIMTCHGNDPLLYYEVRQ